MAEVGDSNGSRRKGLGAHLDYSINISVVGAILVQVAALGVLWGTQNERIVQVERAQQATAQLPIEMARMSSATDSLTQSVEKLQTVVSASALDGARTSEELAGLRRDVDALSSRVDRIERKAVP